MVIQNAEQLIAIGFALSSTLKIYRTRIPGGQLHPFVSQAGGPRSDLIQTIEWRRIAHELGEKDSWALDGVHFRLHCDAASQAARFARLRRRISYQPMR